MTNEVINENVFMNPFVINGNYFQYFFWYSSVWPHYGLNLFVGEAEDVF